MRNLKYYKSLIPWYLNQTLDEKETREIDALISKSLISQHSISKTKAIMDVIRDEDLLIPPAKVKANLLEKIHTTQNTAQEKLFSNLFDTIGSIAIYIAIFLFLWIIFQPGIVIHWPLPNQTKAQSITIYRAENTTLDYKKVGEMKPAVTPREITLKDPLIIPFLSYKYRINITDELGNTYSQEITFQTSWNVLLYNIILLSTSLILVAGIRKVITTLPDSLHSYMLFTI